nr:MAG TPA: hypothetical protein [Caudoviricetes sp.]
MLIDPAYELQLNYGEYELCIFCADYKDYSG